VTSLAEPVADGKPARPRKPLGPFPRVISINSLRARRPAPSQLRIRASAPLCVGFFGSDISYPCRYLLPDVTVTDTLRASVVFDPPCVIRPALAHRQFIPDLPPREAVCCHQLALIFEPPAEPVLVAGVFAGPVKTVSAPPPPALCWCFTTV